MRSDDRVTRGQLTQLTSGVLPLMLADRQGMQDLLNSSERMAACRRKIAGILDDAVRPWQWQVTSPTHNPHATTRVQTWHGQNQNWRPKTLAQLQKFWKEAEPHMEVVVPEGLVVPVDCVVGILPKIDYTARAVPGIDLIDRRLGARSLTPDVYARLVHSKFDQIGLSDRRLFSDLASWPSIGEWQIDETALQARIELEQQTPGDALVLCFNMGGATAGREIQDVEWDIVHTKGFGLHGVGTPLDIVHLLRADGGNLDYCTDLWLGALWVRCRQGSGDKWCCPEFAVDDDGHLRLDVGPVGKAGNQDLRGTVVATRVLGTF